MARSGGCGRRGRAPGEHAVEHDPMLLEERPDAIFAYTTFVRVDERLAIHEAFIEEVLRRLRLWLRCLPRLRDELTDAVVARDELADANVLRARAV